MGRCRLGPMTARASLENSLLAPTLAAALVAGCGAPPPEEPVEPWPPGSELVVLTRNAPTTYFIDREGHPAGIEYELASAFARQRGLTLRFRVLDSVDEVLTALERGRGDVAAAGLTRTETRAERFLSGPEYQEIEELAVCHPSLGIDAPEELVGSEVVIEASTSYQETLTGLRQRFPELEWSTTGERSTEQLLQEVAAGELECTVADSNIVALDRRFLPPVQTFPLGAENSLVWLLPKGAEPLREAISGWLERYRRSGRLQALMERYYAHVEDFDPYDTMLFFRRVDERLPRYRQLFLDAAADTGLPWTLLAALSYQESHWDPEARSPTGVRGLMMLTRTTAEAMGIEDRTDPEQSILAGARYLRRCLDRVPAYVQSPDRLWMALAGYNVGLAHLEDARMLAVDLDHNPNTWSGVKMVLPKLAQKRYYQHLRHGYARGYEPVIYVERIRNYYDLLSFVVD